MSGLAQAVARVKEADATLLAAKPTPFPLPLSGLEAVVAGTLSALERSDWWVPGLRERAGAVLRDVPMEHLIDGQAGSRPYRVGPPGSSPALRALVAVGLALGSVGCAVVHLGIGSASDGALYEALNLAVLRRAPVIFVVAVHPLDGSAPLGPQLATTPAAIAAAFGITVHEVDGSDVEAVHAAVAAARADGGPHLIQADLPGGRTEH